MKKRFFTIWVFLLAQNLLLNHAQAVTTTTHNCAATNLPESVLTKDAGADTYKIQLSNCTGKELGDNPGKNFYWQSFTADPASNPPDDIGVEVDIDGASVAGNAAGGATHALTDGLVTIKNTNAQQVEVRVYVYSSDTDYANNAATYKITMAAAGTGSGGGDGGDDGGGGAVATPVPALPMFGLLALGGLLGFLGLRRLRQ